MSICLVMVLGVGLACSNPAGPESRIVDTACEAYQPLRWSVHDTDETIAQARQHNAVYDHLCNSDVTAPEGSGRN